jgi:fructokinase
MLYGGIELGGTKVVCAVGTSPTDLRAEVRFLTTTPEQTLERAVAFFREQQRATPLAAIGIGSFGPVSPDRRAPDYGYITTTPKPGWAHSDVAGTIQHAFGVPVGFDTDVNASALGEWRWGAAQGLENFLYLTVGTGIGGGGMSNGALMHGLMHPEMGHIRVPHDDESDPFPGVCPYHDDCLEGLASGPALNARWGVRGEALPAEHPAWSLEANYLAEACATYICTLSPQRIILGGGVMSRAALFPLIRRNTQELLAGYIQVPALLREIEDYIVPPGLGEQSGVLGALALAEQAL